MKRRGFFAALAGAAAAAVGAVRPAAATPVIDSALMLRCRPALPNRFIAFSDDGTEVYGEGVHFEASPGHVVRVADGSVTVLTVDGREVARISGGVHT